MSELEVRLKHNGAYMKDGKAYCSVHDIVLNDNGSCDECCYTDSLIAKEYREAQAQKAFDRALENDV